MSAYLISQVEILDPEAWENYGTRAAPAIAQFGGRYVSPRPEPSMIIAGTRWLP